MHHVRKNLNNLEANVSLAEPAQRKFLTSNSDYLMRRPVIEVNGHVDT